MIFDKKKLIVIDYSKIQKLKTKHRFFSFVPETALFFRKIAKITIIVDK